MLGKAIERMQTVAKIMMFINNDGGGLEGFISILVPGRGKTGRMKLIC